MTDHRTYTNPDGTKVTVHVGDIIETERDGLARRGVVAWFDDDGDPRTAKKGSLGSPGLLPGGYTVTVVDPEWSLPSIPEVKVDEGGRARAGDMCIWEGDTSGSLADYRDRALASAAAYEALRRHLIAQTAEKPGLPTEPGTVILATEVRGITLDEPVALMRLNEDGDWTSGDGRRIDGTYWHLSEDIGAWRPAKVVATDE